MRKMTMFVVAIAAVALAVTGITPVAAVAGTKYLTIGTGGVTGVYYPTGGAIARIVNKKKKEYGMRLTVESTGGSVFNINAIMAGDLEFGVVQSDRQFQAFNGSPNSEWDGKPQKNLRALFSVHPESITLCAAVDAGINSVADLKGKRVNIGNPGSGQRQNSIDALTALGIDYEKDIPGFHDISFAYRDRFEQPSLETFNDLHRRRRDDLLLRIDWLRGGEFGEGGSDEGDHLQNNL